MDWDGTCVTNTWPAKSYEWQPGAVEALRRISEFADIIIWTSRIAPGPEVWMGQLFEKTPAEVQDEINYIRQMLDDAGLEQVGIWTQTWKPGATAYVDDKAVHYTGRKHAWDDLTDKLAAMVGREDLIA